MTFASRFAYLCFAAVVAAAFTPVASALETGGALSVTHLLKTGTSWDGRPLVYPEGLPEVSAMVIELAEGGETGWHLHGVPSFGYILQGELEVGLRDGRSLRLGAGDALAEVVDVEHNGRNVGEGPVRLVVFYIGVGGATLTEHAGE